jgi:ribonuclease D
VETVLCSAPYAETGLDNASYHNRRDLRDKIALQMPNRLLEFLQPYSLDFNIIELVWHSCKEYIAHRLFQSSDQLRNLPKRNTPDFKLSSSSILKVDFASLAKLTLSVGVELDFMVTLTQYIQKRLEETINKVDVQIEYITNGRITAKTVEDEAE